MGGKWVVIFHIQPFSFQISWIWLYIQAPYQHLASLGRYQKATDNLPQSHNVSRHSGNLKLRAFCRFPLMLLLSPRSLPVEIMLGELPGSGSPWTPKPFEVGSSNLSLKPLGVNECINEAYIDILHHSFQTWHLPDVLDYNSSFSVSGKVHAIR